VTALLEVRDLRVAFDTAAGPARAVDGVSFTVDAGEAVALVGESGCGKTVTALAILRLIEPPGRIDPASGIRFEGADVLALTPAALRAVRGARLGLVFADSLAAFDPLQTIGAQIADTILAHESVPRSVAERRAVDMLERTGLPDAGGTAHRYSHELSGGQRQRAALAMALVLRPALLIADEPTSALDVTTQAQILDLLRQLQQQREMAIMLITHNLGVIAEMADDVVVMYLGRAVERGPVKDIFHAAKHPYTRALLRSIPSMASMPRVQLPTISGSIPHPYNRPPGCPFHPRCPNNIKGVCNVKEPEPVMVSERQEVSCFLYTGKDHLARA
jgi:peptide/nickel transport system ATP-binding protein